MENIEKNKQNELENEAENIDTTPDETEDIEVIDDTAEETVSEESGDTAADSKSGEEILDEIIGEADSLDEYDSGIVEDDDEDISKVAERITRIHRTMITSSGTVRTRSPEQNRSVTNGIPVRRSAMSSGAAEAAEPTSEKNGKLFNIIIICAIALLVVVTAAIVLINVLNVQATMRPADHNITGEQPAEDNVTVPTPVTEPTQYRVKLDFYSRSDIDLSTSEMTLAQLLESIGCRLEENERPSVALDTVIKEDMVITVDTYEYKTETVDEVIPFEIENIETDLIMRGTKETRPGEEGAKTTEYSVEYVNGVEKTRTIISESITKEPVNEINQVGVGGEIIGADGKTYTYSMKQIVTAKYYSLAGLTWLNFEADETVVTVLDQSLLRTKLYVKNGEYDFGERIVADVSRNLKDGEIYIWISPKNPNYSTLIETVHTDMEIYFID